MKEKLHFVGRWLLPVVVSVGLIGFGAWNYSHAIDQDDGSQSPKLFDSNGTIVGYPIESDLRDSSPLIYVVDASTSAIEIVNLDTPGIDAVLTGEYAEVGFLSSDCTGQSYLYWNSGSTVKTFEAPNSLVVGQSDGNYYAPDKSTTTIETLMENSHLTGEGCEELDPSGSGFGYPVKDVTSLIGSYTPPFHIGL